MHLIDQVISLFATGLTALLLLVGQLFPLAAPQQEVSAPLPAPTQTAPVATTTPKVATSTPTKPAAAKPAATPASKPVAAPTPALAQPLKSQEQVNTETRAALVNILCTTKYGGYFAPISGSGILVDDRGVVLTNAHVAQYFLLRDYGFAGNVTCVVRMGSPAEPYYTAELLYLPQSWVAANASQIVASQALGTGENDYAFLRITGTLGSRTMPSRFPALTLDLASPKLGEGMLLAAYPAGYLGGELISKSLYQTSAVTYVAQLLAFTETMSIDIFSIGGTVVSQSGSSGGAVVSLYDGALKGVIAVETIADTTSGRDLRAITIAHINRSLIAAGQGGLAELLTGNLVQKSADFNANVAPQEKKLLEAYLDRNN